MGYHTGFWPSLTTRQNRSNHPTLARGCSLSSCVLGVSRGGDGYFDPQLGSKGSILLTSFLGGSATTCPNGVPIYDGSCLLGILDLQCSSALGKQAGRPVALSAASAPEFAGLHGSPFLPTKYLLGYFGNFRQCQSPSTSCCRMRWLPFLQVYVGIVQ